MNSFIYDCMPFSLSFTSYKTFKCEISDLSSIRCTCSRKVAGHLDAHASGAMQVSCQGIHQGGKIKFFFKII